MGNVAYMIGYVVWVSGGLYTIIRNLEETLQRQVDTVPKLIARGVLIGLNGFFWPIGQLVRLVRWIF